MSTGCTAVQYIVSLRLILLQTADDGPAGPGLDMTGPFTQLRGRVEVDYDYEDEQLLKVDEDEIEPFKAFESMQYNAVIAERTKTSSARPVRVRTVFMYMGSYGPSSRSRRVQCGLTCNMELTDSATT